MTIKVTLVNPAFPPNFWAKTEPIGLAYIASYLLGRSHRVDVRIIDADVLGLSVSEVMAELGNEDIVGLTFMTPQTDFAYELSKLVKENCKETLVVHGGVHATAKPQESLSNYADYCVVGEGEVTFAELVDFIDRGEEITDVKGLVYKNRDAIIFTGSRPFIENLDSIPYPAWNLLPLDRYTENIHVKIGKALPVMSSRGCPYDCSFCATPGFWRREVRYRSVKNVVGELKDDISKYHINKFHFYDDIFILNYERTKEVCNEMIAQGLDIEWVCLARADIINNHPDILDLLRDSGCRGVEIGVESGDQQVLDKVNKKQTLEDVRRAFEHMKRSGLEVATLQLMTFNIGETILGQYRGNEFLVGLTGRHGVFFGQFATPYPGSRFGETARNDGLLLMSKWSDYMIQQVNFVPNSLLLEKPIKNRFGTNASIITMLENLKAADVGMALAEHRIFDTINIYNLIKKIKDVYNSCDGTRNLKEIAEDIARKHCIGFNEALRFVSKNIVIFAQLGLIRTNNDTIQPVNFEWIGKYYYSKCLISSWTTFREVLHRI